METCELCGKKSEMHFNYLMTLGMFSADICLKCYDTAGDDMNICLNVIKKRISDKGWVKPISQKLFMTILQKDNKE